MDKETFRKEFASIVYLKGMIKSHRRHIADLHIWDKNGSHKDAILRSLTKRDELNKSFEEKLKRKTYEQWKETSRKLSLLKAKLKRKSADKQKIEAEVKELLNF